MSSGFKSYFCINIFLELGIKDGKIASYKYLDAPDTLKKANLPYTGGGSLTRLEPLTKWLPQIVEEVVLGIKEYFASVDLVPYQQLCQHFAEKPARLLR